MVKNVLSLWLLSQGKNNGHTLINPPTMSLQNLEITFKQTRVLMIQSLTICNFG